MTAKWWPKSQVRKWTSIGAVSVSVAGLVAGCGSAGKTASSVTATTAATAATGSTGTTGTTGNALTAVRIEIYPNTDDFGWMVNYAIANGFFQKNGIKPVATTVQTSNLAMAALVAGQQDVSEASLDLALPIVARGESLKLIAGESSNFWQVWAGPNTGISGPLSTWTSAMKGQPFGVTALGTAGQYLADIIFKAGGTDPSAVKFVATGQGLGPAIAALKTGKVKAEMSLELMKYEVPGATDLLNLVNPAPADAPATIKAMSGGPYLGWVGRGSWVSSNPKLVAAFQLSLAEADCFVNNPKNQSTFVQWLVANGAIPKQVPQSDVTHYVYSAVHQEAFFSQTAAKFWDNYDVQFGILKNALPLSSWYQSSTPGTAAAVAKLAEAHGYACPNP